MKILGKKINMTQIFSENGEAIPVTLVMLDRVERVNKDEARMTDSQDDTLDVKEGDVVSVSGVTKGKGFQGVVKRHGFKGGPRSHGQKHSEREAGSIGGGGREGGRVIKGMRMAGRMGGKRVMVKNLKVVKILPESSEIYISGAIPGRRGTKLEIKK
jgi:50S ribosomal protein uL3